MNKSDAQLALEKQLRSATSPWDRLPILIALTKELNGRDSDGVHHYASEAFTLAKELNDPFWIACSLCASTVQLARHSRYSEAILYLKKASRIFNQLNHVRMKGIADEMLARTYVMLRDFDNAMPLLMELLSLYRSLHAYPSVILMLCSIGDVYRLAGDWNTGLKYYRQASIIMKKRNVQLRRYMVYHRLAASYRIMEDSERYRKYMLLSLAACRRNDNKPGIAIALANIGNSYLDQKLYAKAEPYIRQSIRLYHEIGYVTHEALGWARLGSIYEHAEQPGKAVGCYRKGLALAQTTQGTLVLGLIYENFGRLCVKIGYSARGLAYVRKAVALIKRAGDPTDQYTAYQELANVYEMTGDTATALKYHKLSLKIKEEYITSRKIMEAALIEMKGRFRPLVQKLKQERSQNDTLRKMIEQKEAELLTLTLSMIQDEEEISNAKRRGPEQRSASPQKNRGNGLSENWETFARQFHKVHHDFYTNLVRSYPVLTPAEVKVCSLIRIGLSSKEIAGILCISRRTVDSHRMRIHKKMELPSHTSLSGFIVRM